MDQADDASNRIIASAATIDRSIVETKGKDFVTRMQASLPKLPGKEDEAGDRVVAESGATGEAIIKICESSGLPVSPTPLVPLSGCSLISWHLPSQASSPGTEPYFCSIFLRIQTQNYG